jgi:signal transduction histidine kinase
LIHQPQAKVLASGLAMLKEVVEQLGKVQRFATQPGMFSPTPLQPVLQDVTNKLKDVFEQKKILLDARISGEIAATLHPDEAQQILSSLLDNALKFGQEGSMIRTEAHHSHGQLVIKVTNTGLSITADKLAHLFEPFSRATSTEEYDYQGLGINLFIDKLIVERLGGTISLSSNGSSTTATVMLPHTEKPRQLPQIKAVAQVYTPTIITPASHA